MLDWAAVKDLAALEHYCKENPHLNLGRFDTFRIPVINLERTSVFMECCETEGRFWIRFSRKNLGFGNFAKSFILRFLVFVR